MRDIRLFVVYCLFSLSAFADSDGYYCFNKHYLAYEFSSSAKSGIYVIFFDDVKGFGSPVELSYGASKSLLKDGNKSLKCDDHQLIVEKGKYRYSFEICLECKKDINYLRATKKGEYEDDYYNGNLGQWSDPEKKKLYSSETVTVYLDMKHLEKPAEGMILTQKTSTLIAIKNKSKKELKKLQLFDVESEENVH